MKYLRGRDTLGVVVFVFLFTLLLGLIVINIHVFDPFKRAFRDFEFSDVYYSKLIQDEPFVDTNVIIVNIGQLERDSLALLLDIVNRQYPKVIGLDAFFTELRDPHKDSLLRASMDNLSSLVLAGICQYHGDHLSFVGSHPYFGNRTLGYANLRGNIDKTTTIREFAPMRKEGDTCLQSFAAAIISIADTARWEELNKRGNFWETIHYVGTQQSFVCYDVKEVFDSATDMSTLRDKIVLLGYLGESFQHPPDLEDMHFTPMNSEISGRSFPDMRGVVIHANIISMMLRGDYIQRVPAWMEWILAALVLYLVTAIYIFFYVKHHKWFHLVGKVTQLAFSVLLLWCSFLLLENAGIRFSVVPALIVILLSADLIYFYDGLIQWLHRKWKWKSVFVAH